MASRDAQKQQTRERVEEAARALFEERGFDGTTIRAIAQRAGVATGTVMLHCEGKVDLMLRLFVAELQDIVDGRAATLPGTGLLDELMHLFRGFLDRYAAHPALFRVLVKETVLLPPDQASDYDAVSYAFLALLAERVGAHRARLRPEVVPAAVAAQAFALYLTHVVLFLRQEAPDAEAAAAALRGSLELLLAPLWA